VSQGAPTFKPAAAGALLKSIVAKSGMPDIR
jgi:hypothetical protein